MSGVALVIASVIAVLIIGTIFSNWRLRRIVTGHRIRAVSEPTDEVTHRVKHVVAEMTCMDPSDIFLGMTLEDDLGITGDDASDLFEEFVKAFPDVDLSGLDLDRYFGPEGCFPWPVRHSRISLRVSDLVQAAKDNRWPRDETFRKLPKFSANE
jgi:hypothetical protein